MAVQKAGLAYVSLLDHSSQQIQISHGVATQKFPKQVTLPACWKFVASRARRRGVGGHSGTAWPLFFSDGATKEKEPQADYALGV